MGFQITKNIRSATIVVAASDSKTQDADFVCKGTEDQETIQEAIDALPASGGKVQLLEGEYIVDGSISITSSNVTLSGVGTSTVLKLYSATSTIKMIAVTSVSGVVIEDMTIEANGGTGGDSTAGMWFSGVTESTVRGVLFKNHDFHGLVVDANSDSNDIVENVFTSSISNMEFALRVANSSYNVISNNVFRGGNGSYIQRGIGLSNGANPAADHNLIIGNSFLDVSQGLNVAYSTETVVIGNVYYAVSTVSQSSPFRFYSAHNAIISNNKIFGGYSNNGQINLDNCNNVIISNNLVGDAQRAGIYVFVSDYITISDNIILDASLYASNQYSGIYVYSSDYGIISGNIINSSTAIKYGIELDATVTNTLFTNQHSDLFMDVLASSANLIVNAQNFVDGAIALTGVDPKYPRGLVFAITAGVTEYTLTVVGTNGKGQTITEVYTFADDGLAWSSDNAFDSVTSITLADRAGAAATIDVGIDERLGLQNVIYETGDVWKITKNLARQVVATAQVDTDYDTYDMSVIGLALNDDFVVSYRSNLNIVS